jgi:hypothetical protein
MPEESPIMNQPTTHHPRGLAKKFALICAGSSFTCAVLSLGMSFWAWMTYGKHVYTGSLFATTFFFFTAAVVLYEMSRPKPILPPMDSRADNAD